jgi:hypothetical protein
MRPLPSLLRDQRGAGSLGSRPRQMSNGENVISMVLAVPGPQNVKTKGLWVPCFNSGYELVCLNLLRQLRGGGMAVNPLVALPNWLMRGILF